MASSQQSVGVDMASAPQFAWTHRESGWRWIDRLTKTMALPPKEARAFAVPSFPGADTAPGAQVRWRAGAAACHPAAAQKRTRQRVPAGSHDAGLSTRNAFAGKSPHHLVAIRLRMMIAPAAGT